MSVKPILILEGPDGAGKTTLAQRFMAEYGSQYEHFGPLPRVSKSLGRIYLEAMLPALRGWKSVVMDRSWLSEIPYGVAYRNGKDRLGEVQRRMLERVAMRAGATVVSCDPGWEAVERSFIERKGKEMLDSLEQLRVVYNEYTVERTALDTIPFNYLTDTWETFKERLLQHDADDGSIHEVYARSAGNWRAPILIVGESFAEVKDHDPLYQHPFVSFDKASSSHWLTAQLDEAEIWEDMLLWVNADDPGLGQLLDDRRDHLEYIFTLGKPAAKAIELLRPKTLLPIKAGVREHAHPQYWKRFHHGKDYPAIADMDAVIKLKDWSDKL